MGLNLKFYDILISRFVLTHLPEAVKQLERYLPLVNRNGFICIEEFAAGDFDLYSNINNIGYKTFIKMAKTQFQTQNSSANTGFQLLSRLLSESSIKVLHTHISQAILHNSRQKSILRLGMEEARSVLSKKFTVREIDGAIYSLRQFEEDDRCYSSCLTIVAKVNIFKDKDHKHL